MTISGGSLLGGVSLSGAAPSQAQRLDSPLVAPRLLLTQSSPPHHRPALAELQQSPTVPQPATPSADEDAAMPHAQPTTPSPPTPAALLFADFGALAPAAARPDSTTPCLDSPGADGVEAGETAACVANGDGKPRISSAARGASSLSASPPPAGAAPVTRAASQATHKSGPVTPLRPVPVGTITPAPPAGQDAPARARCPSPPMRSLQRAPRAPRGAGACGPSQAELAKQLAGISIGAKRTHAEI